MRAIAASLLILGLVASPAAAQTLQQSMDAELRASALRDLQMMADQRAVAQHNELTNLEAQIRTQRALSDVQAQSYRPILVAPPSSGAQPQIDTSRLASIPDSKLATSNAAVKAAAENRR